MKRVEQAFENLESELTPVSFNRSGNALYSGHARLKQHISKQKTASKETVSAVQLAIRAVSAEWGSRSS